MLNSNRASSTVSDAARFHVKPLDTTDRDSGASDDSSLQYFALKGHSNRNRIQRPLQHTGVVKCSALKFRLCHRFAPLSIAAT